MKEYTLRDASQKNMYPTISGGMKEEKWYPRISFDIAQLPELGSWQVGNEYFLIVKVKEVNHSIREDKKSTEETADFEVQQVGAYSPEVENYGAMISKKLKLK